MARNPQRRVAFERRAPLEPRARAPQARSGDACARGDPPTSSNGLRPGPRSPSPLARSTRARDADLPTRASGSPKRARGGRRARQATKSVLCTSAPRMLEELQAPSSTATSSASYASTRALRSSSSTTSPSSRWTPLIQGRRGDHPEAPLATTRMDHVGPLRHRGTRVGRRGAPRRAAGRRGSERRGRRSIHRARRPRPRGQRGVAADRRRAGRRTQRRRRGAREQVTRARSSTRREARGRTTGESRASMADLQ